MIPSPIILCCDPDCTCRFHKAYVSQQTLCELLVSDMDDVAIAHDNTGAFIDISKWSVLTFDADGDVEAIAMHGNCVFAWLRCGATNNADRSIEKDCFAAGGSIDLQYVPPTVKSIEVLYLALRGTVDTAQLPDALVELHLDHNHFRGSFETEGLPRTLWSLLLSSNAFTGRLHLHTLPETLYTLDASCNDFSGEIDLSALPRGLTELNLVQNHLSGKLKAVNIPKTLKRVWMYDNDFDCDALVITAGHEFDFFEVDESFAGKIFSPCGSRHGEDVFPSYWLRAP